MDERHGTVKGGIESAESRGITKNSSKGGRMAKRGKKVGKKHKGGKKRHKR